MNTLYTDEIQYCNMCGAANKKSEFICTQCQRPIHIKHKPFYDFLKKHTKDELSSYVSDNIFSYIKNFLMSNIYGVALSVTVVTTAVSAVASYEGHIEKVAQVKTSSAVVTTQTESEEKPEVNQDLNEDDFYSFNSLMCNYDSYVDELRSSDAYWGVADYYNNVGEMYAENNIPSFNYGGIHEMISNPINFHMLDVDPAYAQRVEALTNFVGDRQSDNSSAVSGEKCTSSIAKRLYEDGYKVAECNYVMVESAGMSDDNPVISKKLVYKFVFVHYEGKWYIVEDRLAQRVGI